MRPPSPELAAFRRKRWSGCTLRAIQQESGLSYNAAKAYCLRHGIAWRQERTPSRPRPEYTPAVHDGLGTIIGLVTADLESDPERDWGNAPLALEFLCRLHRRHAATGMNPLP